MDASQIPEPSNTIRVGKLLGLDPNELEDALTTKTIFAQGDSVVRIIDDIFTTLFKLYQYFYFFFMIGIEIVQGSIAGRARRLCQGYLRPDVYMDRG